MTSVHCWDHTSTDSRISESDMIVGNLSGIAMSWRITMPSVRSLPTAYLVRVGDRVRDRVRDRVMDRVRVGYG